jgi:uncharacterized protein
MADFDKPSNQEEEYFAREEVEKKRKLALQQADAMAAKQREDLKKLHFMKCPKCGMDLHSLEKGSVEVDTCFNCKGIWLDAGELEQLVNRGDGKGGGIARAFLDIFRK